MTSAPPDPRSTSQQTTDRRSARHRSLAPVVRWLRVRADVVASAAATVIAVAAAAPIASTPLRSDDLLNSTIPSTWTGTGLARVASAVHWVIDIVGLWITKQGRFFPGSAAWTALVLGDARTRASYKTFLAALCIVMIVLAAALAATVVRQAWALPLTITTAATTVTLRVWFDGLDTFSGVVPLTVSLTCAACLCLLRGRGTPSLVAALGMWTYALLTYEVVILLTPFVVGLVWWRTRQRWRALAVAWPSFAVLATVIALRSVADAIAPKYTISLDPWRVAVTAVKQTSAALPLVQLWFPGAPAWLQLDPGVVAITLVGVGVPAAIVLVVTALRAPTPRLGDIGALAGLGAAMWVVPGALVSVTLGWQEEMPRGQGYVSVVWGYVGVAFLLTAAWLALLRRARLRPGPSWRTALSIASVLICILAALNVAQSITVAHTVAALTS